MSPPTGSIARADRSVPVDHRFAERRYREEGAMNGAHFGLISAERNIGPMMTATRRLTAIFAADVAGYSRLMGADEEGTHQRLRHCVKSFSIRKSPNTGAASSRPPATACW